MQYIAPAIMVIVILLIVIGIIRTCRDIEQDVYQDEPSQNKQEQDSDEPLDFTGLH